MLSPSRFQLSFSSPHSVRHAHKVWITNLLSRRHQPTTRGCLVCLVSLICLHWSNTALVIGRDPGSIMGLSWAIESCMLQCNLVLSLAALACVVLPYLFGERTWKASALHFIKDRCRLLLFLKFVMDCALCVLGRFNGKLALPVYITATNCTQYIGPASSLSLFLVSHSNVS